MTSRCASTRSQTANLVLFSVISIMPSKVIGVAAVFIMGIDEPNPVLAILGTFVALTTAHAAEPRIADLEAISLQSGINRIPAFAPDGREGIVVIGWRETGMRTAST